MNKKISKVLIGLVASVGLTNAAFAETKVEEEVLIAPSKSKVVSQSVSTITQVGKPTEKINTLKVGFAKDLELINVLTTIVPDGWTAKRAPGDQVNVKKLVSWSSDGKKTWVDVLTTLANDYNFNVKIDWNEKTIILSSTGVADKETLTKKQMFKIENNASKIEEKVETKVEAKIQSPKAWELKPTMSLKHNIKDWTDKMGWDLVWIGEDYPVDVGVVLQGDLDSEDGPLAQLAIAYQEAKQPLTFTIKVDNNPVTLVVKNVEFEQRFIKEQK